MDVWVICRDALFSKKTNKENLILILRFSLWKFSDQVQNCPI